MLFPPDSSQSSSIFLRKFFPFLCESILCICFNEFFTFLFESAPPIFVKAVLPTFSFACFSVSFSIFVLHLTLLVWSLIFSLESFIHSVKILRFFFQIDTGNVNSRSRFHRDSGWGIMTVSSLCKIIQNKYLKSETTTLRCCVKIGAEKFCKFHKKTPRSESLLIKVQAYLQVY